MVSTSISDFFLWIKTFNSALNLFLRSKTAWTKTACDPFEFDRYISELWAFEHSKIKIYKITSLGHIHAHFFFIADSLDKTAAGANVLTWFICSSTQAGGKSGDGDNSDNEKQKKNLSRKKILKATAAKESKRLIAWLWKLYELIFYWCQNWWWHRIS